MTHAKIFPYRHKSAAPRLRMLCLPFAGGAASIYRRWPVQLGPAIEVYPVELPGRGVRMSEPPITDILRLCDDLAPAIEPLLDGVPLVLFGHSMGARIVFELAHRLDGQIMHVFASGSPAPGARSRYGPTGDTRPTSTLDDRQLTQRLEELGGTPPEILADRDMMARILPIIRADFTLTESYRVDPSVRIGCPITVVTGTRDPSAPPSAAAAWQLRTSGGFRMIELDADHFFLDSHRADVFRELSRDLGLITA